MLISTLNTLLSNSITAEEKKQLLKTEFGITATTELGKEIEEMSNLGYMLVKRAEDRGRKEERAKALKELEEERSKSKIKLEETEKRITEEKDIESVRHSYDLLKATGLEKEEIIRRISENYRKSIEFVRSIVM